MQAQLLRLDSVGARLAELSGIKPQEFLFNQSPGAGRRHFHSAITGYVICRDGQ